MSGFEAECHQLTEQLKELQRAYEKLQGDNAALELSLRETRSMPSGREEPVEQARAAASPSPEENPNRPVRPTPKGWVRPLFDKASQTLPWQNQRANDCGSSMPSSRGYTQGRGRCHSYLYSSHCHLTLKDYTSAGEHHLVEVHSMLCIDCRLLRCSLSLRAFC